MNSCNTFRGCLNLNPTSSVGSNSCNYISNPLARIDPPCLGTRAYADIGDNACLGFRTCRAIRENVTIGDGSCYDNAACYRIGKNEINQIANIIIGNNSCRGSIACTGLGPDIQVGNNACQGEGACCGLDTAWLAAEYPGWADGVPDDECNGENICCNKSYTGPETNPRSNWCGCPTDP